MTAHAQFRDLEGRYRWINFREPVMVRGEGGMEHHFGCRACLALHGLKGSEVHNLPSTKADWDKHMKEEHGI